MKNAVIIYFSNTGNTKKAAEAVKEGFKEVDNLNVNLKTVEEAQDINFFDYDLICIGSPSYNWSPPKKLDDFLKTKFDSYEKEGFVKLKAPKVKGRNALIFCTYSGPHTGKKEAVPVVKYIGQFFEHLGFHILGEWYVLSEMVGDKRFNTEGKMGDIRGLPSKKDLREIKNKAKKLVKRI